MENKKRTMVGVNNTMSLSQVSEHLRNTVFSQENYEMVDRFLDRKRSLYHKSRKLWECHKNYDNEELKIFKPLPCRGRFADKLCVIPYFKKDEKVLRNIKFTVIDYRGNKYVAIEQVNDSIIYYRFHAIRRYAERCLGDKDAELDEVFIGDMILYNMDFRMEEYVHKGEKKSFCVTRDGGFFYKRLGDDLMIMTFIDKSMLFPIQKEIYDEGIVSINELLVSQGSLPLNLAA